jgi:hypothetical protein
VSPYLNLPEAAVRTDGKEGTELLAQAVAAYRSAFEVYTQEQLPQDWTGTQNNLGLALKEQRIRTGGKEGAELLVQVVRRNGLRKRCLRSLPLPWVKRRS